VKPTGIQSGWSSLLHLTVGGNSVKIPGIWFNSGRTSLHICNALNTNKNYCWNSRNLPLNKYTKVEIRQTWDVYQNKYRLIISIDSVIKHNTVNNAIQGYQNVVFYASDPWHPAAKAVLKNLVFQNLPQGKLATYVLQLSFIHLIIYYFGIRNKLGIANPNMINLTWENVGPICKARVPWYASFCVILMLIPCSIRGYSVTVTNLHLNISEYTKKCE